MRDCAQNKKIKSKSVKTLKVLTFLSVKVDWSKPMEKPSKTKFVAQVTTTSKPQVINLRKTVIPIFQLIQTTAKPTTKPPKNPNKPNKPNRPDKPTDNHDPNDHDHHDNDPDGHEHDHKDDGGHKPQNLVSGTHEVKG